MPDSVGNSFDSAQGISLSPSFKTFTESIDPGDTDFYRFTLSKRSSFSLTLTNLAANVDVKLFDGTGTNVAVNGVVQNSTNTGTLVDSINTVLDPGTYYVQVLGGSATATSPYSLNALADNNLRADLAWHRTSGETLLWQLEGAQIANLPFLPSLSEAGSQIATTGDLTGDGFTDLVWRNSITGANFVWSLDGSGNYLSRIDLPQVADLNWKIGGTGDFNGDANTDIVWRNQATGENLVWFMNGTTLSSIEFFTPVADTNWQIQATGDFDLDGRQDIVFRNLATGANLVWFMNGTTLTGIEAIESVADPNWRIRGTGDFNRDGQTDLFWRNYASGENYIWNLNRVSLVGPITVLPAVPDLEWSPAASVTRFLPAVVRDLGGSQAAPFAIGALNGNGIYRDTIGGSDGEDVYQFTVGSPTQLNLTLSGPNGSALLGAVNMRLSNSSNTVVQDSTATGGVSSLSRLIPAGTYFVRAVGGTANVTYDLRVDANNLPVLATNRPLVVSEGLAQAITSTLLRVTDENNTADQITFSVATLPLRGSLLIDGSSITTGSIFTQADINSGRLSYGQNGSETLTDGFSFTVSDGVGGTLPSTSFTIQVIPVNDPPVLLSNNSITLAEGGTASLSNNSLFVTDTEQIASQIKYTLNSVPSSGGLSLGGVLLTTGGTFTQADLATAGRVTYRNNGAEPSTDTFVFSASDGAGGIITPATGVFTFAITNVNDIPVLVTNAGLSVTETGVRRIDSTLLRVTDAEQLTDALQDGLVYTIQSGPTRGTLTRNGTATTTFTQADINNGRILYSETARGVNSDQFTFTVVDNVGATITPTPQIFNIAITGSNFVPVLTTNTGLTLTEGTSSAITPTNLLVSDIDNAPSELIYRVTQLPTNGTLNRFGTPLTTIGQTFTQADLNAPTSLISYRQNGSETTADSFVFTVADGSGNVIPGSNTFSINVLAFNDAPQLLTNTRLTLSEGAIANITAGSVLQATDVDNLDSQITYNVTSGPLNGTLLRSGTTATSFTQADLASGGLVQYQHNGSESTADSFLFDVVDQGGASAGTFTFNIAVTPVNDSPSLLSNTGITLDEGASRTITDSDLFLTDADGPLPLTYTLTTAPTNGVLKLGSTTLGTTGNTTFTQADISSNRLVYTHNGSETTADSFSFAASDSATGTTIGLLPVTSFNILVNSVNDRPLLTTPGNQVVNEDETLTLTGTTRIQVSDPDSDPITVTLTAGQGTINLTSGGAGVTGNNSDTVVVSGTQAALDIALSTLVYRPTAEYSGPDVIQISADDGSGDPPANGTININVRPINDSPTLSLSAGSLSVDEDTPLTITINTTDIDAGSSIVGATLVAPNGRINLATLAGVGFENGTADGGSTLSLAGTITAIAAALSNITYQGATNFNGSDTLTVTVNDRGATGATGPLSVTRSLNLTVNPINDAPRFTLTTAGVTVNEDSGAQTVTGLATGISAGAPDEASQQTLTFNIVNNSNTSLFSVQPTISSAGVLTYTPAANAFGSAIVAVSLSDSGSNTAPNVNTSALSTFTINVLPVNDAPSFSLLGSSLTVNEDAPPTPVLWATGITAGPGETPPQTVNFLVNNNNASLFEVAPTIAPNGTLNYTLAANANGSAIVTVQLKDDGGVDRGGVDTSILRSFTLNVTPVNDAPLLTVPGARVIDEDTTLTITGVSLTDVDAGTQPLQVSLAAPRGTLGFAATTGVTLTNNNSSTVTLVGTQADLNTALGNFTYIGRKDVFGADRITLTANDRGNTGIGGSKVDTKTIDITVNAVNDAPILNVTTLTRTVREDILTAIGSGIRVTDVDSPSVTVTLSALQGIVSLTPNAGITVNDNGTGTVTASGTIAGLNTALTTLRYQGNQDFNGADQVAIVVDDGSATDAKTLSVTVTPVNDLPTLTVPTTLSVNEDEVLNFIAGTLLLTDVDSGTNPISLGLSVTSGTLSLATEGLTGTGNGTRTLSFTGTVDALQAALDTLTYQGNLNFNGTDRLNITVNDRGFTGATSGTNVTKAVSLIVGSVNDLPVLSRNNTLSVNEGNTGVTATPITSALLFTTDSDATDTPTRLTYSIVSAPTNGNLFLGGTTLTGGTFTQLDINSGRLSYRHNGTETLGDSFVFTVTDQTAVLDPSTFNILVLAGNDRPVLTTRLPLTVSEGRVGTIGSTLLQSTDPDNTAAQVRYTLSSRPGNGDLRLNGTNLSIGQSFSQADVASNAVTYRHNGSETTLDSFVFTVNDGSGGSIGSTTFNISITPVNDLPVLLSKGPVTVAEGGVSTLNGSVLLTTDADNLATDLRYTLLGTTTFGTLKLGGTTLNAGGQFTQAQVNQITYEHNGTESTEDFFSFQVSDGIATNPITSLFKFNITPVNDSPDIAANTGLSIAADSLGSVTSITADQLGVTDVDNTPDTLVYTLVSVPDPAVGSLQLRRGGTPVTLAAGGTFAQADIDNGDLVYTYIGGGTSDFFQFTVADGPGASDLSSTFIISFT